MAALAVLGLGNNVNVQQAEEWRKKFVTEEDPLVPLKAILDAYSVR